MRVKNSQREIDKAIANLIKYAESEPWATRHENLLTESLYDATEHLRVPLDDLMQAIQEIGAEHMLFGYVFEEFATSLWDGEKQTLIDDYLKRRGWREASLGRQYLRELNDAELLIWTIINVNPGEYIDLKPYNKPKGKTVRVFEVQGSQSVALHDNLVVRIIKLNGQTVFTGSVLPLPPAQMALFESLKKGIFDNCVDQLTLAQENGELDQTSTTAIKKESKEYVEEQFSNIVFTTWLIYIYNLANQSSPSISNREGDSLIFCKVQFQLDPKSIPKIIQQLSALPQLDYHKEESEWAWIDGNVNEIKAGGATLLGHITLEKDVLVLLCNSQQRGEKGKQLILDTLGSLVSKPVMMLETPDLNQENSLSTSINEPPDMDNPELQDVMRDYLDNHYRQSLDEKIPMLDNKTPRQCAKTAKGKKKLIAWLKEMENNDAHRPADQPHYDFSWIWEELGIKKDY